ncbi:hypothetical protein IVB02_17500 [Bradyrhizobium sp. 166]|uniref:hypothetical protein n=1 Tax=Bradyrhizobium sp. 166 TaxID=2782638 RepID=UPI001FF9BC32|nr:hypothetical protein [Bradyrhizobium sp. 166]MCK1603192.1 hypothetical protein [Bradyrhizobium sp. 166]
MLDTTDPAPGARITSRQPQRFDGPNADLHCVFQAGLTYLNDLLGDVSERCA